MTPIESLMKTLESLNQYEEECIKNYKNNSGINSKCSQLVKLHTITRFSAILEILKNQNKKIIELEEKINTLTDKSFKKKTTTHACNLGFLDY